jgi:hypothetical protein
LDTGVSDIVLNNRYFDGLKTGEKFFGISGIEMEEEIEFIKFNIGGFEKKTVAKVTNFQSLEKFTGLKLLGVIGNDVFNNCELVLDYTFKELTIYQLDKNGNPKSSKYIHQQPQDNLSFYLARGVPYVEVNSNGHLQKMIVDSGATANVMDANKIAQLNSSSIQVREGSMAGFGPKAVPTKFQIIDNLIVGKLSCPPMNTIFLNLDHLNQSQSRKRVDGVLGYEFLSNFRVGINFRKKEIYLWDRESVEMQWAIANKNWKTNEGEKSDWGGELHFVDY